jgi:hypothetical protein
MQSSDDLDHLRTREWIVDVLSVSAGVDQVIGTKAGKLLRNGGLTQAQYFFEFGDWFLALGEKAEDNEPSLVREGLEEFARVPRVCQQRLNVEGRHVATFFSWSLGGSSRHQGTSARMIDGEWSPCEWPLTTQEASPEPAFRVSPKKILPEITLDSPEFATAFYEDECRRVANRALKIEFWHSPAELRFRVDRTYDAVPSEAIGATDPTKHDEFGSDAGLTCQQAQKPS